MSEDTVRAVWEGPFEAEVGVSLAPIAPGEEYDISPEAAKSGHWRILDGAAAPVEDSSSSYSSWSSEGGDE